MFGAYAHSGSRTTRGPCELGEREDEDEEIPAAGGLMTSLGRDNDEIDDAGGLDPWAEVEEIWEYR